jgi:hypothetical protein
VGYDTVKILAVALMAAAGAAHAADATQPGYAMQFRLALTANDPVAAATIRVTQPGSQLRRLSFHLPAGVFSDVSASGQLTKKATLPGTYRLEVVKSATGWQLRTRARMAPMTRLNAGRSSADEAFSGRSWQPGASGHGELLSTCRLAGAPHPLRPGPQRRLLIDKPDHGYDRPVG